MTKLPPQKMFAVSLQYLKKDVNDEVDLLHADKHENVLQIDIVILMRMVNYLQSFQNSMVAFLYNISKNRLEIKLIFCLQINIKVACKVILSFFMSMVKHFQSSQSKSTFFACR